MTGLDQRFKIRAPLRCNGIGRLECAEDSESGMRMAVRWLPIEANGVAAVKACESLPTHPTLPKIRKTGQVGASAYVAMDFPEGRLLSTWEEEAVGPEVLARVASQIADALATIHSQGVFHGEISPDSILLVGEGWEKAYLWDMPLVIANRLTDRRGEQRLMQQLVKTAAFLSPERARGAGASAQSDVYALGAVLCLAAGAPRPSSSTTLGMVYEVANGDWAPEVPDIFPDSLRAMVTRMVAMDPGARPQAREVAETFSRPVAAMPTLREMKAVSLPADPILVPPPVLRPRVATPLPQVKAAELPPVLVARPAEPPPAVPELPMPPPPAADVVLAENIAVAPELADAGAKSFSPEEAAHLFRPKLSKQLMAVAFGALVLLGGLTWTAISLAQADVPPPARPVQRPVAQAPVVKAEPAPVKAEPAELSAPVEYFEDELAPLTPQARAKAPPAKKVKVARTAAARTDVAKDPQPEQFEFLKEEPAAAPAEELKRPSF
jgi:eukaryotic-like serine/threonine-protein kinase